MIERMREIRRRRHRYQKRRRLRLQLTKATDEKYKRLLMEKLRKSGSKV
ncbi:MAG: DUF6800 family protein [Acidobacteriota bacterium]